MGSVTNLRQATVRAVTMSIILAILTASLTGCSIGKSSSGPARDYWPTEGWRNTTPEAQGFDSEKLAEALLTIRKNIKLHSILIIRDGHVVVDAYFYPYDGKSPHELASVTKSIMTTLIGIAADKGKLKLDQPMLSFFPDATIANRDAAMDKITVRHLTNMANGLESTGMEQDEATLAQMEASDNWVQFALDRKVVSEPGKRFVYDSPGMHILSAILQKATGMTALEFARQNLFEPLGIRDVIWPADPQGVTDGFSNIMLYPADAAKIGYLFLNKGRWDGKQIVSQEWVEAATRRQIEVGNGDGYGYGWWTVPENNGEYSAVGRGGQYIRVIPFLDAVIVVSSQDTEWDAFVPYLVKALVDREKPLPANPAGEEKLKQALLAIQQPPAPQPVPPLPEMAKTISDKTFELESNPFHLATLRLEFDDSAEAVMHLTFDDGRPAWTVPLGLDGVYRMYPGEFNLPAGGRGRWEDGDTFLGQVDTISNRETYELSTDFQGDTIKVTGREGTHEAGFTVGGKLKR